MSSTFHIWRHNIPEGPYTLDQLKGLETLGKLSPRDRLSRDTGVTWLPAADILAAHTPENVERTSPSVPATSDSSEQLIWEGRPSQRAFTIQYALLGVFVFICSFIAVSSRSTPYFYFAAGASIILIAWITAKAMQVYGSSYRLTNERLILKSGLFAVAIVEIELFRVRDTSVSQTMLDKVFQIGSVSITAPDTSTPQVCIYGIRRPLEIRESIRSLSLKIRNLKNLRSLRK